MMVLLIAVLASSLTACGSRDSKQPTASSGTPGTSASYSTETDQGAAANETENYGRHIPDLKQIPPGKGSWTGLQMM